jgi:hypothetical protein
LTLIIGCAYHVGQDLSSRLTTKLVEQIFFKIFNVEKYLNYF